MHSYKRSISSAQLDAAAVDEQKAPFDAAVDERNILARKRVKRDPFSERSEPDPNLQEFNKYKWQLPPTGIISGIFGGPFQMSMGLNIPGGPGDIMGGVQAPGVQVSFTDGDGQESFRRVKDSVHIQLHRERNDAVDILLANTGVQELIFAFHPDDEIQSRVRRQLAHNNTTVNMSLTRLNALLATEVEYATSEDVLTHWRFMGTQILSNLDPAMYPSSLMQQNQEMVLVNYGRAKSYDIFVRDEDEATGGLRCYLQLRKYEIPEHKMASMPLKRFSHGLRTILGYSNNDNVNSSVAEGGVLREAPSGIVERKYPFYFQFYPIAVRAKSLRPYMSKLEVDKYDLMQRDCEVVDSLFVGTIFEVEKAAFLKSKYHDLKQQIIHSHLYDENNTFSTGYKVKLNKLPQFTLALAQ